MNAPEVESDCGLMEYAAHTNVQPIDGDRVDFRRGRTAPTTGLQVCVADSGDLHDSSSNGSDLVSLLFAHKTGPSIGSASWLAHIGGLKDAATKIHATCLTRWLRFRRDFPLRVRY